MKWITLVMTNEVNNFLVPKPVFVITYVVGSVTRLGDF